MKIYNMEQRSKEWIEIRKGKMTASHATAIGNCGKGLDSYIMQILAEKHSSGEVDYYTNKEMERGNELESSARAMYELENGVEIQQVGFVEYNEFVGCSPDGLISDNAGVEIKCPNDLNYFKILVGGEKEISSEYIWQIQMNLLVTQRDEWKLVYYNPNFKKSMIVFTILPDAKKHTQLIEGFRIGEDKIKLIEKSL